ncbi:hypothetical protein, partial [Thiorhodococcus mannitoliphagus]|uniref:hypothetical protein n=1 Tax=Thiorhodococcus mannitoliphagus TaxID=329406 RepID=UPI00197E01AF
RQGDSTPNADSGETPTANPALVQIQQRGYSEKYRAQPGRAISRRPTGGGWTNKRTQDQAEWSVAIGVFSRLDPPSAQV